MTTLEYPPSASDRAAGVRIALAVGVEERGRVEVIIKDVWPEATLRDIGTNVGDSPACALAIASPSCGWELIGILAQRSPTVVTAERLDHEDYLRALDAGAIGCVPLTLPPDALRRALEGALRGEAAYPRSLIAEWRRSRNGSLWLSDRDREVLLLLADGRSDKEIAAVLGVAVASASKHVAKIRHQLGAPTRAAAVAKASHFDLFLGRGRAG